MHHFLKLHSNPQTFGTMNVLRLEGGMYMRPFGTKISIFSHILLRLCTPLRSSHGLAKMSEQKLLQLKCSGCLYVIALVPLITEGDEILQ